MSHELDQPLNEQGVLHWGALFEQFVTTEGWRQFRAWLAVEAQRVAFAGCRDESRSRDYWAGLLDGIERISEKPEEIVRRANEILEAKAEAETAETRRAQGLPAKERAPRADDDGLFSYRSAEGDRL